MEGVVRTRVGYAGGTKKHPTYHDLGDHSESIEVDFDPARLSYERLLEVFWESHDPVHAVACRQYRAAVFVHDEKQEKLARASRERLEKKLGKKVATEVLPAGAFTLAEGYHQKYELRQARELWAELARIYPDERDVVSSTAAARLNGWLGGHGGAAAIEKDLSGLGLSPEGGRALLARVRAAGR